MGMPPAGSFWSHPAHAGSSTRESLTRRELLRVGVLGTVGLTLGDFLRLQAAARADVPRGRAPADSVIMIFLEGGMSHLDSFDPKPKAPLEIRGEFGTVNSRVRGIQLSALWGQTASVADKMAFIRSMSHDEAAHERGAHSMLTGHPPSPTVTYPSMGAVVAHQLGHRHNLPAYIGVPNAEGGFGFAGPGFLSPTYGAFSIAGEAGSDAYMVRDLGLPAGMDSRSASPRAARREMLSAVDGHFRTLESADHLDSMDSYYQRAYSLISSREAREAFNIQAEPQQIRNAYGRSEFGQRALTARRLIEAGARFVTLFYSGWDMHVDVHGGMRNRVPDLDLGLGALIRDLDKRGLLSRTLVVVSTEFGRTPRINRDRGRDHWPAVFSVAFAGGGIHGGQVIGASSKDGSEPQDDPVTPADMAATIYTQLGIDPGRKIMSGDRPVDIVHGGRPIRGLS